MKLNNTINVVHIVSEEINISFLTRKNKSVFKDNCEQKKKIKLLLFMVHVIFKIIC